jgi:3-hydroxyisobutyrate dehydrogenase-like beta-hydroxyacid dehydrogenase
VERCRPGLESAADPLLHLGPVGSGQIAKLVNNTMLAATIGLGADAISFGADLGLDPSALAAALAAGSARGTWSSFVNRPQPDAGNPATSRTTEWARKDVSYALGLAAEAGLDPDRHVLRLARRGVEVVG